MWGSLSRLVCTLTSESPGQFPAAYTVHSQINTNNWNVPIRILWLNMIKYDQMSFQGGRRGSIWVSLTENEGPLIQSEDLRCYSVLLFKPFCFNSGIPRRVFFVVVCSQLHRLACDSEWHIKVNKSVSESIWIWKLLHKNLASANSAEGDRLCVRGCVTLLVSFAVELALIHLMNGGVECFDCLNEHCRKFQSMEH